MTSFLTFSQPFKNEVLNIVLMKIDDEVFEPQISYNYFISYKYSYGEIGTIFWIWFAFIVISMSIVLIYRLIRMVSLKNLMSSKEVLLDDFKKRAKKLKNSMNDKDNTLF